MELKPISLNNSRKKEKSLTSDDIIKKETNLSPLKPLSPLKSLQPLNDIKKGNNLTSNLKIKEINENTLQNNKNDNINNDINSNVSNIKQKEDQTTKIKSPIIENSRKIDENNDKKEEIQNKKISSETNIPDINQKKDFEASKISPENKTFELNTESSLLSESVTTELVQSNEQSKNLVNNQNKKNSDVNSNNIKSNFNSEDINGTNNVTMTISNNLVNDDNKINITKENDLYVDLAPSSSENLILTKNQTDQVDFNEFQSLKANEARIRQQYAKQSIQQMYSNIFDRSSIENSLHIAIMKGDDILVEQILFSSIDNLGRKIDGLVLESLSYRDRLGRTALHIASYGSNPRIVDLIFLSQRLYYDTLIQIEIKKLKEERKKCLIDLKSTFKNESLMIYNEITFSRTPTSFNYHRDDYRIIAIEKWYQNEITRCHRKLEFQVESAWLSLLSERDSRGLTPLHYCVCSNQYSKNKIANLSVLEALISPIQGGRGQFTQDDIPKSSLNSKMKSSIERSIITNLSNKIYFEVDSIYNLVTGQEIVTFSDNQNLLEQSIPKATSKSNLSKTFQSQLFSLKDLTSNLNQSLSSSTLPSMYDTTFQQPNEILSVDYEVIIPWLIRNIYKRALSIGEKLGASAIEILEEIVELVDPNYTRTLIVPEIKDFLRRLGIVVTDDIIKELCNMYPGSLTLIEEKWSIINQFTNIKHNKIFIQEEDDEEDEDEELYDGDHDNDNDDDDDDKDVTSRKKSSSNSQIKDSKYSTKKKSSKKSQSKSQQSSKQQKKSSKGVTESSHLSSKTPKMLDLYDLTDERADSKDDKVKTQILSHLNPFEDFGLDFNKLIDDISSGRGMKSITTSSFQSTKNSTQQLNLKKTIKEEEKQEIPFHQEDILVDLIDPQVESKIVPFDCKLELPQTVNIRTISKYRKYIINLTDEYLSSPLLISVAMNKREVVEQLLSFGADITISSIDGHTPLSVASDTLILSNLQKKLMKYLKKGNPVNKLSYSRINFQSTNVESLQLGTMNLLNQSVITKGFGLNNTQTTTTTTTTNTTNTNTNNNNNNNNNKLNKSLTQICGTTDGLFLQLRQLQSKRWNYSQTALSWVIGSGMNDLIENMINSGVNVKDVDAMGRTALHQCCELVRQITVSCQSDLEEGISTILKLSSIAEILLNNGADIMAKTNSGRTPLHDFFCSGKDVNVTTLMKKTNRLKELSSFEKTLNRTKSLFVRRLIQWGSDPHATDRQGYSPLHYCSRENMEYCMIEMLKYQNINILFPCPRGRTILHFACLHGSEEVAEVICKWDADEFTKSIQSIPDCSGKLPRDLMAKDMNLMSLTTIWQVCRSGNSLRLNEILSKKKSYENSWNNVEEYLSETIDNTKLNDTLTSTNNPQKTFRDLWLLDGVEAKTRRKKLSPLHFAVLGWIELSIHENGNICGKRALGYSINSVSSLTNKNKSNSTKKRSNNLSNHQISHSLVISILLQNFAYVDSLDKNGRTPLMYAAASNLSDCVQIFLRSGAELNLTDSEGNTALHYAYAFGCISTISLLEEKGCNSEIENIKGETPLSIAGKYHSISNLFK